MGQELRINIAGTKFSLKAQGAGKMAKQSPITLFRDTY